MGTIYSHILPGKLSIFLGSVSDWYQARRKHDWSFLFFMLWPDTIRLGRVTSDVVRGISVTQFIGVVRTASLDDGHAVALLGVLPPH